ncbi:hypothetical protein GGF44_003343 [Coemansia sp. RSA 1694]|nr:hypothetical protein IWW47_004659 [Coemansia sp. RSA 2052]KAJ2576447.1 hypothetical protein GGH95_003646 [Coemansia sp. RSA 1836]KAJ2635354.1 hypothetical protein GGF44_003343 [Coemansia sp. RSA 1694]
MSFDKILGKAKGLLGSKSGSSATTPAANGEPSKGGITVDKKQATDFVKGFLSSSKGSSSSHGSKGVEAKVIDAVAKNLLSDKNAATTTTAAANPPPAATNDTTGGKMDAAKLGGIAGKLLGKKF